MIQKENVSKGFHFYLKENLYMFDHLLQSKKKLYATRFTTVV